MSTARNRHFRLAAASRGGSYSFTIEGDAHIDWYRAVGQLGSEKAARKAYTRALNHTGRKAHTAVKSTIAKQVGLPQNRLTALGRLKFQEANTFSERMSAKIVSTGRYLPLSEFRPTQVVAGTKASPWGKRRLFGRAFMFAGNRKSGTPMPKGFVFINSRRHNPSSGRDNLPLPVWGPSIPKELVKRETKIAFERSASDLGERVAHEVSVMTKGIVGK